MRCWLIAVLALLLAAPALGQSLVQPVGPDGTGSGVKYMQKIGTDGAAAVREVNPSYANWSYEPLFSGDLISNVTTDAALADSTDWFQTNFARGAMLFVHQFTAGDTALATTGFHRVAIQIRLSFTAEPDTAAVFSFTPWAKGNAFYPGVWDSLNVGATQSYATDRRPAKNNSPTAREFVLRLPNDQSWLTGDSYEWPKGFVIPLGDIWAPYMQIRLRTITPPVGSYTTGAFRTRFWITYAGSSL